MTFSQQGHWLRVGDLSVIWSSAQRALNEGRAKQIADHFDPDAFGTIAVAKANGSGTYHVIDGQHRVTAVRQLFGDNEQVPCTVYKAETAGRAAQIFDEINTGRKAPSAVDTFLIRVEAGYETETAVHNIIVDQGFRVGTTQSDGCIRAVQACTSVYKQFGADILQYTLMILQVIWGKDHNAVDAPVIRGTARFLAQYGQQIKPQRLTGRVSKELTPGKLLSQAKAWAEMSKKNRVEAICEILVNTYNNGLKQGRIGEAA